jgi:hypothetical protein
MKRKHDSYALLEEVRRLREENARLKSELDKRNAAKGRAA